MGRITKKRKAFPVYSKKAKAKPFTEEETLLIFLTFLGSQSIAEYLESQEQHKNDTSVISKKYHKTNEKHLDCIKYIYCYSAYWNQSQRLFEDLEKKLNEKYPDRTASLYTISLEFLLFS